MPSNHETVEGIETAPEPMGAKATDTDPRVQWREDKAQLRGFDPPVRFSTAQAAAIDAIAETIIPAAGTFPAASDVEIVDFFGRYVTPDSRPLKYFPLAPEKDFNPVGAYLETEDVVRIDIPEDIKAEYGVS